MRMKTSAGSLSVCLLLFLLFLFPLGAFAASVPSPEDVSALPQGPVASEEEAIARAQAILSSPLFGRDASAAQWSAQKKNGRWLVSAAQGETVCTVELTPETGYVGRIDNTGGLDFRLLPRDDALLDSEAHNDFAYLGREITYALNGHLSSDEIEGFRNTAGYRDGENAYTEMQGDYSCWQGFARFAAQLEPEFRVMLYEPNLSNATGEEAVRSGAPGFDDLQDYLTEVYGYTPEETETGFDYSVSEEDDRWIVRARPKGKDYAYTCTYQIQDGALIASSNPFSTNPCNSRYPGENSIQAVLREAREEGWFLHWNAESRRAMDAALEQWEVSWPVPGLKDLLALEWDGEEAAALAVRLFFSSCYGSEMNWPPALEDRFRDVLAENGLLGAAGLTGDPFRTGVRERTLIDSAARVQAVEFVGPAPEALNALFAHPMLSGWECAAGAYRLSDASEIAEGMAVFEKDGKRLFVMFQGDRLYPIGEKALFDDAPLCIRIEPGTFWFRIVGQLSASETDSLFVKPMWQYPFDAARTAYCSWKGVRRANRDTLEAFLFRCGDSTDEIATYDSEFFTPDGSQGSCSGVSNLPPYWEYLEESHLPRTQEEVWTWEQKSVVPAGYAVCQGVHLRQSTSSRSKDLGLFDDGVLVRVLGTAPGDPFDWANVQAGGLSGYMVTQYLELPHDEEIFFPLISMPRSAVNPKPASLKQHPGGLLNPTVTEIGASTHMLVLAQSGDWWYVMIPDEEICWPMPTEGVYGYVRADQVLTASMAVQLDWLTAEAGS